MTDKFQHWGGRGTPRPLLDETCNLASALLQGQNLLT